MFTTIFPVLTVVFLFVVLIVVALRSVYPPASDACSPLGNAATDQGCQEETEQGDQSP